MSDRFLVEDYTHSVSAGDPKLSIIGVEELLELLEKARNDETLSITVSEVGGVLLDRS